MGLLKGALTVRRYHVEGEVPDDFRDRYTEALQLHAFREPASDVSEAEAVGWCLIQNLLDTNFNDRDRWLVHHYIIAGLRADKKVLPSKLYRAHRERRLAEWCATAGQNRAPADVRHDIEDQLAFEMLSQTLPRVQVTEWTWNIVDGWVVVHSTAQAANDRFRKLFRETFGLVLTPFSPLDFLVERSDLAMQLESQGTSDFRFEVR